MNDYVIVENKKSTDKVRAQSLNLNFGDFVSFAYVSQNAFVKKSGREVVYCTVHK